MTCANCEALRERIATLERELGVRRRDGEIGALMAAFGVSGREARLLLVMNANRGGVVRKEVLMNELSTLSEPSLKTVICRIGGLMGHGEHFHNMRGVGYGLTPMGCSKVLAALQPPEMQPDRGPLTEPTDEVEMDDTG